MQFVDNMEGPQTPSWLGLPNNAEKVLLTTYGMFSYIHVSSAYIVDELNIC